MLPIRGDPAGGYGPPAPQQTSLIPLFTSEGIIKLLPGEEDDDVRPRSEPPTDSLAESRTSEEDMLEDAASEEQGFASARSDEAISSPRTVLFSWPNFLVPGKVVAEQGNANDHTDHESPAHLCPHCRALCEENGAWSDSLGTFGCEVLNDAARGQPLDTGRRALPLAQQQASHEEKGVTIQSDAARGAEEAWV